MRRLRMLSAWMLAWALVLVAAVPPQTLNGQRESAVKAAFLIKFASFVDWPATAFSRPDEPDAAGTLAELLEMMGHTVNVANSGEAALAAVKDFEPDIVVLDIGMPGMDGYEVARRLAHRTDLRRRPVLVAATGWGTEADRARAMAAGFDRHLTKPIEVKVLEAIASLAT
jgi:two-component system, OmpR family, response regulator